MNVSGSFYAGYDSSGFSGWGFTKEAVHDSNDQQSEIEDEPEISEPQNVPNEETDSDFEGDFEGESDWGEEDNEGDENDEDEAPLENGGPGYEPSRTVSNSNFINFKTIFLLKNLMCLFTYRLSMNIPKLLIVNLLRSFPLNLILWIVS